MSMVFPNNFAAAYNNKVILCTLFCEMQQSSVRLKDLSSLSIPSLLMENGAIDPPPSYSISGRNLSLPPCFTAEMLPLLIILWFFAPHLLCQSSSASMSLRLPYTFRSTIFPEIGFLHPSNSLSVIFHLKKKVLKKSEYRRRYEHISFLTGSKNSSLE